MRTQYYYDDNPNGTRKMLQYTYDVAGRVTTMKDYEGYDTLYTYTVLGQVSTLAAPGSKTWDYDYNALGQPTKVTLPNGMTTNYSYDGANRMTKLEHKDGATVKLGFTYALTAGGQITRITHQDGGYWAYANDGRGRLTTAARYDALGYQLAAQSYTYDAGDNMLTKVADGYATEFLDDFQDGDYTSNPTWTVGYGSFSVTEPQTGQKVLTNASNANYHSYIDHSTTSADGVYRFSYRLTSGTARLAAYLRLVDVNNQIYIYIDPSWMVLRQFKNGASSYLYWNNAATTSSNTWYNVVAVYSGANVTVWRAEAGGAYTQVLSTTSAEVLTNTKVRFDIFPGAVYDIDNVSLQTPAEVTTAYQYNAGNELTKMSMGGVDTNMTYDDWGRLITKTRASYTAAYDWYYGNNLKKVDTNFPGETTTAYLVDGLGKRRIRVVMPDPNNSATWQWTCYRWDAGWNVIGEYDPGTDSSTSYDIGARNKTLVHRGMATLAEIDGTNPSSGTARYYAHDHLGSTRGLYSSAKAELGTLEFNPYGDTYASTGTQPAYSFTGKPYDTSIGMYFFPYRYYSPEMDRWITRDPLGMADGPNLHGYVNETPIDYADPLGLTVRGTLCRMGCWTAGGAIGGLIGGCGEGICAGVAPFTFGTIVIPCSAFVTAAAGGAFGGIAALCNDLCPP